MSRRTMLKFFIFFTVCILHTAITLCIEVDLTAHAVKCNGGNDGQLVISVSESTNDYTIRLLRSTNNKLLSQKQFFTDTLIIFQELVALNYKIQVISTEGLIEKTIQVIEPEALKANIIEIINYPTTEEACDGIIKAMLSGGTPPYSFNWGENTKNANTTKVENLCEGIYRCYINDKYNCSEVSATVYLYEKLNTKE